MPTNPEMSKQGDELKRKLLRTYDRIPGTGERLINPDGPEAVAFIEQLQTQNAALREGLEEAAGRLEHYGAIHFAARLRTLLSNSEGGQ